MTPSRVAALAAVTLFAVSTARAGESVTIAFGFEDGAKSSYDVSLDLDIANTAGLEEQMVSNEAKTTMKLVMDTTTTAAEDSSPELAVTFRDLVVDQTITGPAGETKVEIRGGDVKVERDSRTVIDTKNGKGKELAGALLAEFSFLGEEATLVLDPKGRVAEVKGSGKLVEFLATSSGPGLFVFEAPGTAVEVGETWRAEPSEINRLKGLDLSANPLPVETSFTLESVDEKDGRSIAKIAVKSPLAEADISTNASNEVGVERHVVVRSIDRTATGTVLFDLDGGVVAESDIDVTIMVEMEIEHEGEKVRHEMEGTAKIRTKLRPVVEEAEPKEAEANEERAEGGAADAEGADE
jgi:hypothetical protein